MRAVDLSVVSAFAIAVAAQNCPLQFDGRVSTDATLASFDTSASRFNPQYVLGASLSPFNDFDVLPLIMKKTKSGAAFSNFQLSTPPW